MPLKAHDVDVMINVMHFTILINVIEQQLVITYLNSKSRNEKLIEMKPRNKVTANNGFPLRMHFSRSFFLSFSLDERSFFNTRSTHMQSRIHDRIHP